MNQIFIMGFLHNPKLNKVIVFRMVKMSVENGISNVSAFAFACYGSMLVNELFNDIEGGYTMGRTASEMVVKLKAVEVSCFCFILC